MQKPHPPVAIAGLTPGSENHKLAGEKGYIPVSLSVTPDASITAQHWAAVEEGAARSGRTPDRADWRVIRDVYVAPTDDEARDLALGGIIGRSSFGVTDPFPPDPIGIDGADRPGSDARQVAESEQRAAFHLHIEHVPRSQPLGHVWVSRRQASNGPPLRPKEPGSGCCEADVV